MSKKALIRLIVVLGVIGIAAIAMISILAYYSIPWIKLNNAIVYANKNDIFISESENDGWISVKNLSELDIVDEGISKTDVYLEIDTQSGIQSISYNKIVIEVKITATVKDKDSFEPIDEFSGTRTVSCSFQQFEWIVDDVK